MADNTNLSAAVGDGDDIRTVDRTGVKTPVSLIDIGGAGAESLLSAANPMPLGVLPAGSNNIGDVDVLTLPALPAGSNNIGDVDVLSLPSLPTGTNTIGRVGLTPQTAGGLSASKTISGASTNATTVKASAGQLFGWYISNLNASPRYLKLYNKASNPTVGTDVPVMTLLLPGNSAGVAGHVEMTNGIDFTTGIAFALTTGAADADTGAVAANEIIVNLFYK